MSLDNPFDDTDMQDMEFKVVLIGDGFVGKTSIINRFYSDHFSVNEPPTIAASYIPITLNVSGKKVCLNVWDTAGHEKFHCLVPLYARASDAVIVVFDLSNPQTFDGAKEWFRKTLSEIGDVPCIVLCGNKIDLIQGEDFSKYKQWAEENNALFFTTSALEGTNIKKLFTKIAETLASIEKNKMEAIELKQVKEKKKKGCC